MALAILFSCVFLTFSGLVEYVGIGGVHMVLMTIGKVALYDP